MPPQFNRKLPNHLGSPRKTIDNFRPKKSLNSKPTRFDLSLQKQLHKKLFICLFLFPPKKSLKIISMQFWIFAWQMVSICSCFFSTLIKMNFFEFLGFLEFEFYWFFIGSVQGLESRFLEFLDFFFFAFWRELVQNNFFGLFC